MHKAVVSNTYHKLNMQNSENLCSQTFWSILRNVMTKKVDNAIVLEEATITTNRIASATIPLWNYV